MSDATPYEELDPSVVALCRAINAIPGLRTVESCGGHPEGTGTLPPDEWLVIVQTELDEDARPTMSGWLALEWFAWLAHDCRLWLEADAPPPWLNDPGAVLAHTLHGSRGGEDGIEPDEVAALLTKQAAETLLVYLPEFWPEL